MDKVELIKAVTRSPRTEIVPFTTLTTDFTLPDSYQQILSIGIFTHGEIMVTLDGTPVQNKNVPDVILHKQNAGAYGCLTLSAFLHDKKDDFNRKCVTTNISMLSLKKSMHYFYRKKTYASFTAEEKHPLHCSEGTCRLFTDKTKYYEKKYMADDVLSNMILSYASGNHIVSINLINCDVATLLSAVGMSEETLKVCEEFCDNRDAYSSPTITTTKLHKLITLFKTFRGIQQVNILDLSCNVMKATPRNGTNTCEGYGIHDSCVPAEDDFGWGGKRKKRTKKYNRIV